MKALGLVVSDKTIFENCILTPWPTYVLGDPPPTTILVEFGQIYLSGSK